MKILAACCVGLSMWFFSTALISASEHLSDVIYTKHDGVALTMDVFKPQEANGAGIIKIISGGWRSNHKYINDGGWPAAGYTTFVVVHGTQPRFQVEEIVADMHRAVRFIRAHASEYGVDPNKLGITGGSAGGHLSLMIATRGGPGNQLAPDPVDRLSSAVQAVACFFPPTDYLNWGNSGESVVGTGLLKTFAPAFGPKCETPGGQEQLGRELSPLYWIHDQQPPVYMVHGDADEQVPIYQAQAFKARCDEVGTPCELRIRSGAGHGGWNEMSEDNARMIAWFDQQLLGKQAQPQFENKITTLPSTPKPQTPLNTLSEAEQKVGWVLLFDGKTLEHWRGYQQADVPASWEIRNGAITMTNSSPVGAPGAEGTGLITKEKYADFELCFEWQLAEGGNSGVMYHVSEEFKKPHETGPEYQLSDALNHPDGKKSPLKWSGACYGMYAPVRDLARPPGEWNKARIVVKGNFVEHWLNNEQSAVFEMHNAEWEKRLAWGKWTKFPHYGTEKSGHICLQDHGHTVAYRNIKIKLLP